MSRMLGFSLVACVIGLAGCSEPAFVTLASTTSTQNSGLLDAILPQFERESGVEVRVVAVGTGQALRLGQRGDVDVLLVHDRVSEERFVAEGHGLRRVPIMWNDFVIVGPAEDPAGVRGTGDVAAALAAIAGIRALFVSRGDDSGTHKAERRLWQTADFEPSEASGSWYREIGSGMGATLNTAAAMQAYALADRGTWLAFRNRQDLELLVEGDPRLRNPYGAIVIDPARHPHVKAALAEGLVEWLRSPVGAAAIAAHKVEGEVLFHPNLQASPDR